MSSYSGSEEKARVPRVKPVSLKRQNIFISKTGETLNGHDTLECRLSILKMDMSPVAIFKIPLTILKCSDTACRFFLIFFFIKKKSIVIFKGQGHRIYVWRNLTKNKVRKDILESLILVIVF